MAYLGKLKKWLGFTSETTHGEDENTFEPGERRELRLQKAISLRELYSNSTQFYDRVIAMLKGEVDGDYIHIISKSNLDRVQTFEILEDGQEVPISTRDFILRVFNEAFSSDPVEDEGP